ncbi:lysoplasmalogenase family protein [Anaerosporobacter faecicola]|uniref:lysoplasmalogenase family protein n=1 Tax=Anaerosporobacter faecicola TaxID=2718714 RepID=UPI00143C414A|nr:lysoplasmalogenase family protein [Anaerosporobacter faecicola]
MQTIIFLGLQLVNYISFLMIDLCDGTAHTSSIIKYTSILLCFLYVLLGKKQKRSVYMLAGLFFTLVSDYFLLFTDEFAFGLVSFSVVQTIYSMYCSAKKEAFFKKEVVHLSVLAVLLIMLQYVLHIPLDIVLVLCGYYGIHLISNLIMGWRRKRESRERCWFAIGMTAFVLCDIHVAIMNAGAYLTVSSTNWYQQLYNLAVVACWFYYLPSQVCLAMIGHGDFNNGKEDM